MASMSETGLECSGKEGKDKGKKIPELTEGISERDQEKLKRLSLLWTRKVTNCTEIMEKFH